MTIFTIKCLGAFILLMMIVKILASYASDDRYRPRLRNICRLLGAAVEGGLIVFVVWLSEHYR